MPFYNDYVMSAGLLCKRTLNLYVCMYVCIFGRKSEKFDLIYRLLLEFSKNCMLSACLFVEMFKTY